ncbi:alpha-hydroxy acid oxidase [Chloroflexota bacterium]
MKNIFNMEDARRLAYKRLPKFVFDFVDGGAEDEVTLQANRRAFNDITFNPRVLVGVSERDMRTTVLGEPVKMPVLLGPAGGHRLIRREGELAASRAAGHEETIFVLSTGSNYTIEDVAAVSDGSLWFQLYPIGSRDDTALLIDRAKKAGYKALCVCVDVAMPGKRERDLRNQTVLPPRVSLNKALQVARRPAWLPHYFFGPPFTFKTLEDLPFFRGMSRTEMLIYLKDKGVSNAGLNWDDLAWFREMWSGPLVVKGIMTAEDAKRVVDYGADGIIVSNHGGRQLDCLPPTIEILPEVVKAVAGKAEVFVDGGIRRGSDVLKAIALGARACLIARPYLFGMSMGGDAGIIRILNILEDEIDRSMALLGCRNLSEVDRSIIRIKQANCDA